MISQILEIGFDSDENEVTLINNEIELFIEKGTQKKSCFKNN